MGLESYRVAKLKLVEELKSSGVMISGVNSPTLKTP